MGKGGALLATFAASLAVAAPAYGAPGWATPAASLSSTSSAIVSPDVAVTPAGDTIAAWWEDGDIKAAVRPKGGSFGGALILSENVAEGPPDPSPRVVVSREGRALLTWVDKGIVRAVFRSASGGFGTPQTLSSSGAGAPRAAFTSDGRAVVTWERGTIEAAIAPANADFSGLGRRIDGPGADRPTPAIAADSRGNAYLVWVVNDDPTVTGAVTAHLRIALSPAGSTGFPSTGVVELVNEPAIFGAPTIAASPDGSTAITWVRGDARTGGPSGFTYVGTVQAVVVAPNFTHGAVQKLDVGVPASNDLTVLGTYPSDTRMAADANGNVAAVWTMTDYDTGTVTARRATLQTGQARFGSIAPPVASGRGTDAPVRNSLAVSGLASGGFFVGFTRASGVVQAVPTHADGGLDPTAAISAPEASTDASPRFAPGPAGDALAVWATTDRSVKLAVYDATPPELRNVRAPGAIAGEPAEFGASPFDAWTPVTVAWQFGDDTPVVGGTAVFHAFARAGRFTVTVLASDALGNSSTETRSVDVVAPDKIAPTIRSLSLSRRRFAVSTKATALVAATKRARRGTTIRYAISEPSTVKMYLSRILTGHRLGRSCSTKARSGRICKRFKQAGALTRQGPATAGSVPFSGRLGRAPLRPGRYRLTVVAIDAAGNRSRSRQVTFRVVRR